MVNFNFSINIYRKLANLNRRTSYYRNPLIKNTTILGISLLISFLVNLPRTLIVFKIDKDDNEFLSFATFQDLIFRFVVLFLMCLAVLSFNCNWRERFNGISEKGMVFLTIGVDLLIFALTAALFLGCHDLLVDQPLTLLDKKLFLFVYLTVTVLLFFISKALRYRMLRNETLKEAAQLKEENLQNELSALKNQINPHFLFNSLNTLSSLTRGNKEATAFIGKLSFMYRYILLSSDRDLVTLDEELKFLKSYIFLMKTRFSDKFNVVFDLGSNYENFEVPILSLQLLVENAVKHNEISVSNPLEVSIKIENNNLIVSNKIRIRNSMVDSTNLGLANLDKRYFLLKKKHIKISNNTEIFEVTLPLK
ncbi:MAG: hypothetical protein BM564_12505 [Bacteroidetes bacterium MedPE-SWsnd-G2]|nr:MAG: hypothetical protein BM564_12505 [Bacteroidetes bacterium MedPE-SWsnd-G2]